MRPSIFASLLLSTALVTSVGCNHDSNSAGGDDTNGDGGNNGNDGGNGNGDANCPSVRVSLTPVVPQVTLLIDRSGSMTSNFGGGLDRWEAVRKALTDPTTGVVTNLQSKVLFGAVLYDGTAATCPDLIPLAPALNNRDAIDQLFVTYAPSQDTPTGEAITGTLAFLDGLPADPDGVVHPKYIVLATDGEPDTCAVPNPQTGQPQAVSGAQGAYASGTTLFILSVGNEVSNGHQQDMANAGAGKALNHSQGDAPFFNGSNPADLAMKFQTIIGGVRDCTLTLDGSITAADAPNGVVQLDADHLAFNDPNGWTLVDDHTIKLVGTACTKYLADENPFLSADFPCGTVIQIN